MPELFLSPVFVRSYLITTGEDAMDGDASNTDQFNVTVVEEVDYPDRLEPLTSDLWIGVVLILMILSCVGCVCSCLLYHKFQQWKHHERRPSVDPECPRRSSSESLPSYTLVTGLPTYAQAMEAQEKLQKCGGGVAQLSPASLVLLYPPPPPPFEELPPPADVKS